MSDRLRIIRQECVDNGTVVMPLKLEEKLVLILQNTPLQVKKLFHRKVLCLTDAKVISNKDTYLYSLWFLGKMGDKVDITFMTHYHLIEAVFAVK